MQDFRSFLARMNFAPPTVELDGKIHRFDRDGRGNGWYIGWQNHSIRTGKTYVVAKVGDWKTGEEHLYKPEKVSRADGAAIAAQIDEARRRSAEDKARKQEEASLKAEGRWAARQTSGSTPYLVRKLVPDLYGCGLYGETLMIPVRDADGKLWGIESVYPDGKKLFMSGQRVDGCFHVIGTLKDEAYVAEGFSTAASVHQATGLPVVVAFYAGNLGAVVKALKTKWPALKLTIAGDDDRLGEGNPGREKGEKAALLALGAAVFPRFKGEAGTDFNDLHAAEGLDEVRAQLGEPAEAKAGFLPLGYDEGTFFFYHVPSRDIVKASAFSNVQMFQIAPREYWAERYPSKVGVDMQGAIDDLIQMSKAVGPFDGARIRGMGVWIDEGRVVLNTGSKLLVDGLPRGMTGIKSQYIYVQTKKCLPQPWAPLADAGPLLDACSSLCWQDKKSPFLLAGWLAVARIAGALPIRPHVWLTGGSGTGKSTVMERIIAPVLGSPRGNLYLQGSSTEAGIRQTVKSSSIPLIFDEFEATSDASKTRISALVELLRSSWSSTRGEIVKGSAGGFSVNYPLSFAALVSSVRVSLDNDADRSRFSVLELAPHSSDQKQWAAFEASLARLDEAFGERLFARSCSLVRVILESYKTISRALAVAVNQRCGQQMGILLAGYWSLRSAVAITTEEAAALVESLDLARERSEAHESDQVEALTHLCTTHITIQLITEKQIFNVRETLGEIICEGNEEKKGQLRNWGIKVGDEKVYIHTKHRNLIKDVWKGTRWETCYGRSLARLVGSERAKLTHFTKDVNPSRAIILPKAVFVNLRRRLGE